MKQRTKNWRCVLWKQSILLLTLVLSYSEANAGYDKICDLSLKGYTSPSLNGCVMHADSAGTLIFKVQNKKVEFEACQKLLGLDSSQLNQFKNMAAEFKGAA